MALLPSSVPVDLPDPVGYRLDQYLALLKDQAGIMSKRRNGVLVLSSQGWYREESTETPWRAVKRLREMQAADPSGIVGLDGLAWLVRQLTPAQLARFAREYSGANAPWLSGNCCCYREPRRASYVLSRPPAASG